MVIGRTVYLRGDVNAFNYFGYPTQVDQYANRWIAIPDRGQIYRTFAAHVTLGSFFTDHIPRRDLRVVNGAFGRTEGIGVRGKGTEPGPARAGVELWVYVHSPKRPLPALMRSVGLTIPFKDRTTLGPWNKKVSLKAPTRFVSFTRLARFFGRPT
jgi:hypothetical protein